MTRLNPRKPVLVYRNLSHGRKSKPLYSVMQNGRVVRRTHAIMLRDVQFLVRESGRQRVLQQGRKNVPAFARGYVTGSAFGTDRHGRLPVVITYNPYVAGHFWEHTSGQWREELCAPVYGARCVVLNKFGMTAAYLNEPLPLSH
jgi:hypothetical protein